MLLPSRRSFALLVAVPLGIVTILNVAFLYIIRRQLALVTQLSEQGPLDGDLLRHWPSNQVALEFKLDSMPITNEDIWSRLIPSNGGTVTNEQGKFVVGMYQQLRCLDDLRVAYLAVHNRAIPGRVPNATAAEICLGQLWQIIQCNADITLDPSSLVERNGKLVPASSGAGVNHRCNDWRKVRDAVEGVSSTSI